MLTEAQSHRSQWFDAASPTVLALPGTVFADNDEDARQAAVRSGERIRHKDVQNALEHLGMPANAYTVKTTDPIYFVATLRGRFPPTQKRCAAPLRRSAHSVSMREGWGAAIDQD
jgi:hypothetical protein